MANLMFDYARELFADGQISWSGDVIKAVLVSADYTVDQASDQFLSDIPSGARIAISGPFTSKTFASGVLDADDLNFSAVVGDDVIAIVIFKDTEDAATSPLIAYLDEESNDSVPFTPDGTDVVVLWSNEALRILKI